MKRTKKESDQLFVYFALIFFFFFGHSSIRMNKGDHLNWNGMNGWMGQGGGGGSDNDSSRSSGGNEAYQYKIKQNQ